MPYGIYLDWTTDQFCSSCNTKMRRQKKDVKSGLVAHEKDGLCRRCANKKPNARVAIFDTNGQVCCKCETYKPFNEFTKNKDCLSGHNTTCKKCKILWIHGIDKKFFDDLLSSQGHKCGICKKSYEEFAGSWTIDHDHECCGDRGKKACGNCVRGILCSSCNTGLGMMRDNIEVLSNAITYITTYKKESK